ncbi:LysE family translocator [Solemya velesiana gill symbiont]|uniref:Threonine transporter RhtB n=1 Tax=Solemya velesiana gill symbiont TaxID=1918948 RepID=A0A1T2KR88_9GAMM|nr:LysE family translocator [Solemya velesiana gill symbiont]OOZ35379.1 threonine transporter RhtB [Solemya velesiana gill symbiont]
MLSPETLLLFITSSTLLALAPGPDNLFVLAQSMTNGARSGLLITLGLCTGLLVHTSAVAFTILKFLGAAYLLYLAWQLLRPHHSDTPKNGAKPLGPAQLYRRGIIMNITNPKVSIFFMAFLPQFTDPTLGNVTLQLLLLGALFILSALVVFGAISLLSGSIGKRLRQTPRVETLLNRMAGTVFAALAVKLLVSER